MIHNAPPKIIGSSPAILNVIKQAERAANHDMPILLLGETGTGKDLIAQLIHDSGTRKNETFLPLNLGAIPGQLVASEIFGHEKGAFTGALENHPGAFEQTRKGTVFLDEIDAIDEQVQVSLLRLIEQKKFRRLGGRIYLSNNARIIAASNQSLAEKVKNGSFRADLFYRLDAFRIFLPPLRERSKDVHLLALHFLRIFNEEFGKNVREISPEGLEILENYSWPGNIRELKNVIQRAVLLCRGRTITPENFPPRFHDVKPRQIKLKFEVGTPLHIIQKEMVKKALLASNKNRQKAAELLGISRRAIYNKIKKFNLS